MSDAPVYGNLEDTPIYGNLEGFTNIYSDEDFEAASERFDLPPLPPKPQKRVSPNLHQRTSPKPQIQSSCISNRISARFQGVSMNIKNKTTNKSQSNTSKNPKQIADRKEKKEANNTSTPNSIDSFSSTSVESLNKVTEPKIPNQNHPKSSENKATPSNKPIFSCKCFIVLFVAFVFLSVAGAVVYFKYTKEIMCFIGYGECSGMIDILHTNLVF